MWKYITGASVNLQENEYQKRKREEYICEAFQEHSNGWYGDSACEFLTFT